MGTKTSKTTAKTTEDDVPDEGPITDSEFEPTPVDPVSGEELQPGDDVQRAKGDVGVPMIAGSQYEPQGPEDALGEGLKRGDYRDRVNPRAHEGSTPQAPRAEDIGDAEGLKGGVDTAPATK
jgi:hypothetical protein